LLVALTSTVILGSKSHGTRGHILLSNGSGSLPLSRCYSCMCGHRTYTFINSTCVCYDMYKLLF
jgi:hypothetical protein